MLDKLPIILKDFKGVNVPDANDLVFPDFGIDNEIPSFEEAFEAQNIRFLKGGGFRTRESYQAYNGFSFVTGFPVNVKITGFWPVRNLKGVEYTSRFLFLTWDAVTGRLYEANGSTVTLLLTVTGMKYAFVINAFERMYISPWGPAWGQPLPGSNVYVWNGDYVPRLAQGSPLDRTGAPATAVANSASAGNVTPGTHLFDVVYETDTGFITSMYNALSATPGGTPVLQPLSLVCNGNQVTVSNIKTGAAGSGIIKRHILMSKLVTNYDNTGWLGWIPYFAYTINDNTTTTVTFDKPDAGLVEDASYLLDATEGAIRACTTMSVLNGRMVYYGLDPKTAPALVVLEAPTSALISPPGDPERVDALNTDNSRLLIGRSFPGRVNTGLEFRGINYTFKETSTFAFREEIDKDPAEWNVDEISSGIGAYPLGASKIADKPSSIIDDLILVAGPCGIYPFTGSYPSVSSSLGWWGLETLTDLKFINLFIDPNRKLIYATLGDTYGTPAQLKDYMWVGDFSKGFSYGDIRWSKDILTTLLINGTPYVTEFRPSGRFLLRKSLGTRVNNLFIPSIIDILPSTDGVTIISEIGGDVITAGGIFESPLVTKLVTGYTPNDLGDLFTFNAVRIRALTSLRDQDGNSAGDGSIDIGFFKLDDTAVIPQKNESFGTAPGKSLTIGLTPPVTEKIKISISTTGTNGALANTHTKVWLDKIVLFGARRAEDRARS